VNKPLTKAKDHLIGAHQDRTKEKIWEDKKTLWNDEDGRDHLVEEALK